jgi:adenylate cyclase
MGEGIFEVRAQALVGRDEASYSAHDWVAKGLHHLTRIDPEQTHEARRALETALDISPSLPIAVVGLAWTHAFEIFYGWPRSRPDTLEYCLGLATGLLRSNERYDHAHRLLARLYHVMGRHDEALLHSERAWQINPYNSDFICNYGQSLAYVGRAAEGVELIARAIRINPYAPAYYRAHLATAQLLAGHPADALETLRPLERSVGTSRLVQAASLVALERAAEARAVIEQLRREQPKLTLAKVEASLLFKRPADREAFLGALAEAGLPA